MKRSRTTAPLSWRRPRDTRPLTRVFASTPNRLLLTSWGVILALYFFGPVTYHHIPTLGTWIFIALCTLAFLAGGWLSRVMRASKIVTAERGQPDPPDRRIARVAAIGAWLGIVGIAAIAADKLLFSGLDYSQGITSLRLNQDAEMLVAGTVAANRTPFLYLGYAIFSFSVPAFLIFLLRPEAISPRLKLVVHLGILSPVAIAFLYGGRSPIVLVCTLVVGAMIVRRLKGQTALPYSRVGVIAAVVLAVAVVGYIHYIFVERLQTQGVTRYEELARRFEEVYDATPSPLFDSWLGQHLSPAAIMTLLNLHLYFTHEFFVLDLTLNYAGKIGPYFGQYQLYLLSVLIERFTPSFSYAEAIRAEAQAAGVFGWFSTAWGGMFLDFGFYGALPVTLLCGFWSERIFRKAVRRHRLAAELIACYVAASIVISPNLSPFTVSISLPILSSILFFSWLLNRQGRAAVLPNAWVPVSPVPMVHR